MRQILLYLIAITCVSSCKTYRNVYDDNSHSLAKPIELVKKFIINDKVGRIQIEIVNSHNGEYRLNTIIEIKDQDIKVITRTKNMYGLEKDTLLLFSETSFLEKLDYEKNMEDKQLVLAGNNQVITIRNGKDVYEFFTRRGFGLMNLLIEGKSNIN